MGSSVFHMDSTTYAAAVAAKIRTAIEEKGISVLSVATSTGIPRTTLDRRFKSDGAAPFTVREIKKIANILGISASELTTVYEIAEKVGFSDPHYFGISFKKMTGCTPTEYAREKRR